MHETTGSPSTRTVHAPHSASSHPIFVPVRRRRSRRREERVSPRIDSNEYCLPFTERFMFDIPLILFCAHPCSFKHIFEQTNNNMTTIIGTGSTCTGAEAHLSEQCIHSSIERFIVQGFANQYFFCLGAAPWSGSARPYGNADLAKHITFTFQPNGNVDD